MVTYGGDTKKMSSKDRSAVELQSNRGQIVVVTTALVRPTRTGK